MYISTTVLLGKKEVIMSKLTRKALTMLLSLAMMLSMSAGIVFADDVQGDEGQTVEQAAFSGTIEVIDSNGATHTITGEMIEAATKVEVSQDDPWKYSSKGNVKEAYGTFYKLADVLSAAGIDYSEAHGLKVVASDGFTSGNSKDEIDKAYIYEMSEVTKDGAVAGDAGTYGVAIEDKTGEVAGNRWGNDVVEISVADSHVWFIKGNSCKHYCTICNEGEPYLELASGEKLYDCEKADASKAEELIDALPTGPVTDENKETFEEAVAAYNALSDSAKAYLAETSPMTVARFETAEAKVDAADAHEAQAAAEEKTNAVIALSANMVKAAAVEFAKDDYTADSYKVFAEALEAANAAMQSADATAADITAANTGLETAMTGLVMKEANPLKVTSKTATVKYANVKKKAQTLAVKNVLTVKNAQGTVAYVKSSGNSKITINKTTGKVTVKKGLKKGTYSVKVKVTASGDDNYKAGSNTVTFKIKVK